MNKRKKSLICMLLCTALLLSGCSEKNDTAQASDAEKSASEAAITSQSDEITEESSEAISITTTTTTTVADSEEDTFTSSSVTTTAFSSEATETVTAEASETTDTQPKETDKSFEMIEGLELAVYEGSFYVEPYKLTNISDKTIENIKERLPYFDEFNETTKMTIEYPNGDLEIVVWNNGVPDYGNSDKYFDALGGMDFTSADCLEPGEYWIIDVSREPVQTKITTVVTEEEIVSEKKTTTTTASSVPTITSTTTTTTTTTTATAEPKKKPSAAEYAKVMPDDTFIKTVANKAAEGETIYISLDKNGTYKICEREDLSLNKSLKAFAETMTKEYYNSFIEMMEAEPDLYSGLDGMDEYYEMMSSYDSYLKHMLELMDMLGYGEYFNEKGELKQPVEDCIFFSFRYYDGSSSAASQFSNAEIAEKGVRWMLGLRAEEERFANAVNKALEDGNGLTVEVSCSYSGGDEIDVNAFIRGSGGGFLEYEDTLTLETEGGIFIADVFVPADTEKLYISSRDSSTSSMLVDFLPKDCVIACDEGDYYDPDYVFDLKRISEALPELKELYMFQTLVSNPEAIGDMENLTALSYYAIDEVKDGFPARTDTPFTGLKKLKTLRLYAEYSDYNFLGEMDSLEDVFVELQVESAAPSLFKQKCVTAIDMECSVYDMAGIKNLTNLKELKINNFLDPQAVSQVVSLEKLEISRCGRPNFAPLESLKNLKELSIQSTKASDWSFLKKLKKLDNLSLGYTNTTDDDIKGLGVTELSLTDTSNHYTVISEMPKLKTVFISGIYGSIDDFKGSDTLEYYGELFGDGGNYSTLALCPNLKNISLMGCKGVFDADNFTGHKKLEELYLNGTEITNILSLGKIKTFKIITVETNSIDSSVSDELKKALPDCDIMIGNEPFFANYT